jgi:hypothetical protein
VIQAHFNKPHVKGWGKRRKPGVVELNTRLKEAARAAEEDDPNIDALAPLNTGNNANNRVLKRAAIGH